MPGLSRYNICDGGLCGERELNVKDMGVIASFFSKYLSGIKKMKVHICKESPVDALQEAVAIIKKFALA